jgi:hypothetical protein
MNNEDPTTPQEQLRESWIDALLVSATASSDHEDRIAQAMRQIDDETVVTTPSVAAVVSARKGRRSSRWIAMGIAASVLLAVFLVAQNYAPSRYAMATVDRSLNVAAERLTRKYQLQIDYRDVDGKNLQVDSDLYVQGTDRFALRHPGLLPGTSFWLGQDGSEAWFVPAFGAVRRGNNTLLSRWLRSHRELDTPYLHLTTLLSRMSRGYRLKTLPNEDITTPDGKTFACRRISAELNVTHKPNLPDVIELWASRDSGMAVRLVAQWNLSPKQSGRERLVLEFESEEPVLADSWFTAEAHFAPTKNPQ